jgi:hypothetical protein
MPEEWRWSILVPIFKNKGDVQICCNYRGIKLMNHTMKLWERVIEHRLRRMTSVTKKSLVSCLGGRPWKPFSWYDNLWRATKSKRRTHMVFNDLEKAYDKIP